MPLAALGGEPKKNTENDVLPNQVLISKSDMLSPNSGLSSVTIQTSVKSLPQDIPESSDKSDTLPIAEQPSKL